MKKIIILFPLLLSLIYLNAQKINDVYDFPVKPGSLEWQKFTSKKEKDDACQVPKTLLKNLTTEALTKTCLDYPLFENLYFFNDLQTGFNTLKSSFNGFQELLSRADAGKELLKIYNSMDPTAINKVWNDTTKGSFTFNFVAIEVLLSQPEILNNIDKQIKTDLKTLALQKFDDKRTSGEFSYFSSNPSMLIVARILDAENKLTQIEQDTDTQLFLSKGVLVNPALLDKIYKIAKQ